MDANGLKAVFHRILALVQENRDYLIELDRQSGDGDLGISMCSGFLAASANLDGSGERDLGRLLNHAADSFNEAAPSSLGTILTFGMKGMARVLHGHEDGDTALFAQALTRGCSNIMEKALSKPGQKTVLDALCPGSDAFASAAEEGGASAAAKAAKAAAEGAASTASMQAVFGRAAYYGQASIGKLDGGAVVGSLIFKGISDFCSGNTKEVISHE